jgi:hypothetical protein
MLFVILEPLVTFAFAAFALLGLLTTLFFYLVGLPDFPLWTMLALSLGFAIVLVPYHALIRMLSNASWCDLRNQWGHRRQPAFSHLANTHFIEIRKAAAQSLKSHSSDTRQPSL